MTINRTPVISPLRPELWRCPRKRLLECADAADVAFHTLVAQIELVGWSKAEAAAAMLYLAQHRRRPIGSGQSALFPAEEFVNGTAAV
jgi:hypothetical protein